MIILLFVYWWNSHNTLAEEKTKFHVRNMGSGGLVIPKSAWWTAPRLSVNTLAYLTWGCVIQPKKKLIDMNRLDTWLTFKLCRTSYSTSDDNRPITSADISQGWFRRGCGGGRGGCAPSYSVDSCLQRSNGVWWVEVLSCHVFLSSSGMYCLTISSAWLSTFCRLGDRDGLVRIGRGGVAVSLWVVSQSNL